MSDVLDLSQHVLAVLCILLGVWCSLTDEHAKAAALYALATFNLVGAMGGCS